MPPRLTIITPSFNHARYLRKCIDSVLSQNYPNLQYLVIDGGSTDGSIDILQSYGDAIQWRSRRDRGQAAAINEGLRQADGEVIAWLNSDDYFLPGAFAHAMQCLEQHPDAAMIYGRGLMVDDDGRTLRPFPTFAFRREDLARKCYVCQPTAFVRRSVIDEVGLLNERLHLCLDYEWWLRISRRHRLAFCDHALAAQAMHDLTKTRRRRLRSLIEGGYLMREHFGRASWRWAAKWLAHQWSLDRRRFLTPVFGWYQAWQCAARYRRRFGGDQPVTPFGRRLLDHQRRER